MHKSTVVLTVNGKQVQLETMPHRTLLQLLREDLGLTGTKNGCEVGECGTCTILMDGKAQNACLILAGQADGHSIETIEGLSQEGKVHPIQRAFMENGAVQCGFCTPGMIMAAKALLDHTPEPSRNEIMLALSGNLCRCTGYVKIIQAVEQAAQEMSHARP